jgi:hypothetical protein
MAIRSGLAAQIGIGVESTVGTAATPTRFYEFNDESIAQTIERIESEGLRTGNRVLRSDRFVSGQKAIEGSFSMDMTAGNTAILFKHALGAVATAGSFVHTCTMSDPFGLGLTLEVGRPGNDGTVRAFTYAGCKINTLDLSVSVGELLSAEFGIIGTTAETIGSVTSASYGTGLELLHFAGAAITVGGTAYPCKDFSLSVNNGLTGDRYVLGSQIAQQPIASSMAEVTGSLVAEFVDATAYNRVVNATTAAIVATFTDSASKSITVTVPVARFDGDTPTVGGPDILDQTLNFKGLFNGTDSPVTIAVANGDSAP